MKNEEVIQRYETFLVGEGKSKSTTQNYVGDVLRFFSSQEINPQKEAFQPITKQQIAVYRDQQIEAGLSSNTINRRISAIFSFFGWAQEQKLIPDEQCLNSKHLANIELKQIARNQKKTYNDLKEHLYRSIREKIGKPGKWKQSAKWWIVRDAVITLFLIEGLGVEDIVNLEKKDVFIFPSENDVTIEIKRVGKTSQIDKKLHGDAAAYYQRYVDIRPFTHPDYVFFTTKKQPIGEKVVERALKNFAHRFESRITLRKTERFLQGYFDDK